MTRPYYINDEHIDPFSSHRIESLKQGLGEIHPQSASGEINDNTIKLRNMINYTVGRKEVDYTHLAIISYQDYRYMDSSDGEKIHIDLSERGISAIWRSLGIPCEAQKRVAFDELITKLVGHFTELEDPSSNSCRDVNIAIMTNNNSDIISEDEPFHPYIKQSILLSPKVDRHKAGREFVKLVPSADRPEIPLTWMMSLAHRAYLDNVPAAEILRGASELVEGVASGYDINDPLHLALFRRRCLARIAMGFRDLMDAIDFNQTDIRTLGESDHPAFAAHSMSFIRQSPLSDISFSDGMAGAYYDAKLLEERGIIVDIDLLMDIELHKYKDGPCTLAATAGFDLDILKSAVDHPLWMRIPRLYVRGYYTERFPPEVEASLLHRKDACPDFITYDVHCGGWDRDRQANVLNHLQKRGAMSMNLIKMINPDGDILMQFRDSLPRKAFRHAIENDMGI